jgi:competence protein ComFC
MKFLNDVFYPIIDFIYPSVCCICDQPSGRKELPVCSSCWKTFKPVSSADLTWMEIKSKFNNMGNINDFLSCYLFELEGNLQEVIHLLKYGEMTSLGVRLGRDIGTAIANHPELVKADYLVPVPLHNRKKRERGYNQTEFICKGINQIIPIPVVLSFLERVRYTESQTLLSLAERIVNVDQAFTVRPSHRRYVKGKSFIIVDDVITTGSTIDSCAGQLLLHGAVKVFAVSAALAS